jgi:hypothetical protein
MIVCLFLSHLVRYRNFYSVPISQFGGRRDDEGCQGRAAAPEFHYLSELQKKCGVSLQDRGIYNIKPSSIEETLGESYRDETVYWSDFLATDTEVRFSALPDFMKCRSLERSTLSLVRITEAVLQWRLAAAVKKSEIDGRADSLS